MRNRPNAEELLDIAEQTLAGEVAPDLSPSQRYNVALVTSAMGIARRELAGGATAWAGEAEALQRLYAEDPAQPLAAMNRSFAADLRAGAYDEAGERREAARQLLREDVLARLSEDNPRYRK